jgi:hypothetical protein
VDNHDYIPFAWLSLLRRLTDMTADSRDEVRNGAVHTTLRIFDNHGDDLTPNMWQLCLETILLRMVDTDVRSQTELRTERDQAEDWDEVSFLKGKIGTSQIILEGMSKLFASYLDPIVKAPDFAHLWRLLADSFAKYGECDVYDLSAAVYSAITQILSKVPDAQAVGAAEIERISMIWDKQFPVAQPGLPSSSNLKAFEAYATSLKDIYRLRRSRVTAADSLKITQNLERCIRDSDSPSYSSDLDSLTALQSRVVDCLYMLRSDIDSATSTKVALLARFIGLPFEAAQSDKPTTLTFIALSKASMDLLQDLTKQNAAWKEIFGSGTLLSALSNIERTISLKYQWPRQGKNPPLWRKAVSTSLAILEHAIPHMFEMELDQSTIRAYWEVIVRIARNIAHADREGIVSVPDPAVSEDEDFDTTSLTSLSGLIIPALGSPLIPDSIKRAYTRALFTASVIHGLEDEEALDLDNEPLNKLYNIRFGRTYDPEPTVREKMSYFCFRGLVSLLRVQESSAAQIKLAKAAAPYVILRVALPLKTYIADQPLRGKLPMPESQKLELVRILGELREVRCEPAAIPDAEGVKSNEGRHLVRLFPLVVKAVEINGDEKVKHELVKWLNKLGGEFGL